MGYYGENVDEKLAADAWNLLQNDQSVSFANFLTFACAMENILPESLVSPSIANKSDYRQPAGLMIDGIFYFSRKEEVFAIALHFK
jgi:hypothetical protein